MEIKLSSSICVAAAVEKKMNLYSKYLKLTGNINFKLNLYLFCYGLEFIIIKAIIFFLNFLLYISCREKIIYNFIYLKYSFI